MRKITELAYKAFMKKKAFKKGNTEVRIVNDLPEMYLFGNKIAVMNEYDAISISSANWVSKTTRERLNAFTSIRIEKGDYILNNNQKWDGRMLNISQVK